MWATTVAFNVFLSTTDRACKNVLDTQLPEPVGSGSPQYQLNVSALSASDFVNIPVMSGLSGGILVRRGRGPGEVRDCDNVRVANVEVATVPGADRFTYFNGNPVETLPDAARAAVGTDRLGLYAAFNIKPGPVFVEAAGGMTAEGALESFGSFNAFVYAGAVSVVNLNGGKGTR